MHWRFTVTEIVSSNIEGRARVLGDDINTDYIITSARKRETIDEHALASFLLETIDPTFAASVRPGDILAAGRNFGCGSAMEVAATVILAAGIRVVIARSFARSFYRNAVNNGLVPIECDTSAILEGDALSIELGDDDTHVFVPARNLRIRANALPPFMRDILDAGGLVPFVRTGGLGRA